MNFARGAPIAFCVCMSLGFTMAANAALQDRGGGMIYDDDRNITWLQDANYAQTSGASLTGQMNWQDAVNWAANLSYGGFTDWRLPATVQPDESCSFRPGGTFSAGFNCTGSELGYMFYTELGGTANTTQNPIAPPNLGLFTNLQADAYWSDTEFGAAGDTFCPDATPPTIPFICAWDFHYGFGAQAAENKSIGYYAWAVRTGDVPAPATAWLLGTGILVLIGRARRRLSASA